MGMGEVDIVPGADCDCPGTGGFVGPGSQGDESSEEGVGDLEYNGFMSANRRHQCPECGYEYEPWVEICPDCGVLVEDVVDDEGRRKSALLGRDEDPHWKVVTNVPNAIIGSLLKSQLEDAGIPVLMRRSASADIA